MSIGARARKILWGRAGSRCAFPECRCLLIQPSDATSTELVLGEEAHIIARERNGPRGDASVPPETRDAYSNLILLCPTHHSLIDLDPGSWPVQRLLELK